MREILQEEVVHNCRGGFPCTWGGLLWFMWSASEVEDGAWLLFTWGQGEKEGLRMRVSCLLSVWATEGLYIFCQCGKGLLPESVVQGSLCLQCCQHTL